MGPMKRIEIPFDRWDRLTQAAIMLAIFGKRPRRRPPAAGMPAPVEPRGGPLPLEGGAEAPLEEDGPWEPLT